MTVRWRAIAGNTGLFRDRFCFVMKSGGMGIGRVYFCGESTRR